MSGPQTAAEWQAVADQLAEHRRASASTSDPERFPAELGIDPASLRTWAADDAVDSLKILLESFGIQIPPAGSLEFASMLATHTQCGIEIGLWLVKMGQVQP